MERNDNVSVEDQELDEFQIDPVDLTEEVEVSLDSAPSTKRGRRRIPEQWTRVVSLQSGDQANIRTYSIATDLLVEAGMDAPVPLRWQPEWRLHFYAKDFVKGHPDLSLRYNQLAESDLAERAKEVTKFRKEIRDLAVEADQQLPARL
jgi:hypothetical protein